MREITSTGTMRATIPDYVREMSSEQILEWAAQTFGSKMALITSFQKEGMVILDMLSKINSRVKVITIDTGRLHEETYSFMENVSEHYGMNIEIHFPDAEEVRHLVSRHGVNLFYHSIESRLMCCQIRKVHPLTKILNGLDAWVTGLRKEQSASRSDTQKVELDRKYDNMVKINPLADWTEADVMCYIAENQVPEHPLYSRGYLSIGCAPCTKPISNGEHHRAGRWWWEKGSTKECGLHCRV